LERKIIIKFKKEMPINYKLEPKKHAFRLLFGQDPLTVFKDYRKNIRVELLEPEPREKMMRRLYQFVKATWADSPEQNENPTGEQMKDAINAMLSGKALGLGLEATKLTFRISGITRLDLQQIVRQRIGVVYSVQCSGDRDLRHDNILVEECIAKDSRNLDWFISSSITSKTTYSNLVDRGISIQAARSILPESRELFMFMDTNLSTFLFFHMKRIETESQTWQMNEIAQQMADRLCEVYPELKDVFEKNKRKFKFQEEASKDRTNLFSTSLYIPENDTFEYHPRDFLYQQTKKQMHYTNTPIENTYFWGNISVTEKQYLEIKKQYNLLDEDVSKNHYSNEEILGRAKELNQRLLNESILI
jgi:thymidylate synthase ThyX